MIIVRDTNYHLQFVYITVLKPKANEVVENVSIYENSK